MSESEEIYCHAPFYHSHVDTEGANRLCCIAMNELIEDKYKENLSAHPIDFWNSEYMKNRRALMLKNQSPPECYYCRNPNSNKPYKDIFKSNFEKRFKDDSEGRLKDNTITYLPISIDYRTAICNLKCLMCNSGSSTAINAQFKKQEEVITQKFGSSFVNYRPLLAEKSERTFEALEQIVKGENLKHIYFAGGEPTMTKDHLGLLDRIRPSNPTNITYNTNLMQSPQFVTKWKERLLKFQHVGLFCSIDAVGEIGEYLRDGLTIEKFETNLNILTDNRDSTLEITLDATITSLSLFNAIELSQFAINHEVELRGRLVIESYRIKFMQVNFIEKRIREKIWDEYEIFYNSLTNDEQNFVRDFKTSLYTAISREDFNKDELRQANEDIEFFCALYPQKTPYSEMIIRQIKRNGY